ncbi:MAG: DUF1080 domain-containing protein [Deltaproteobacteria bacterium]|nr:DUF1080 domain-containing protein [Deltaproteobacteria bacterium]
MRPIQPWSILTLVLLILGLTPMRDSVAEATTLRLNWQDNSPNESGFKIERLAGSNYVQIASVGANVQSYTDSGLTTGTNYCYRVRAFNSSGTSSSSNNACATAASTSVTDSANTSNTSTSTTTTNAPTTTKVGSSWGNYRATMKIRSTDNDAIGVMFRYQDSENYYRFSWYPQGKSRRLEKRVAGTFQVLAQDTVPYTTGQTYTLQAIAQGSSLKILIDGKTIFSVTDTSIAQGAIALYSHYNAGSSFDDVLVEDLASGSTLLSADFNDGSSRGWTFIDEGNQDGPSSWSASNGALTQNRNIGSEEPGYLGSYALYTEGSWKDYRVSLKMRSHDDDPFGIMFRYQDNNNYYRFSWDKETAGRQLLKRENGAFKIIAHDAVPYVTGQNYRAEIIAQGNQLKVNIDGKQVFATTDESFRGGRIALFSSANNGVVFDDVLVVDLTGSQLLWDDFNDGKLSGWTIIDDAGTAEGPSAWSVYGGELIQKSNIGSDAFGTVGTFALY